MYDSNDIANHDSLVVKTEKSIGLPLYAVGGGNRDFGYFVF